ncbi:MAG: 30S ribosome-binding factor RbfA [Bacteroidota bacterium]
MSIRTERVSKLIQKEVADLLNNDFHETSQSMLTITGARVTKDLGIVYLDVSVLGETEMQRKVAFRRLEDITPQVRAALASRVRHQMRRVPELRFFLDERQQQAAHMDDLFAKIRAERVARGAEDETATDDDVESTRGDY